MKVIDQINNYEKVFNNRPCIKDDEFIIDKGTMPVMISAPHTVDHFRHGHYKIADLYTAAVTQYLHKLTGCHIIYSVSCKSTDPNYDDNDSSAYKQALRLFIIENDVKVLIDLHGCLETNPAAIEIGTVDTTDKSLQKYSWIAPLVVEIFRKHLKNSMQQYGKIIVKNQKFTASNPNTITNFIFSTLGIPCFQLEINRILEILTDQKNL